MAHAGFTSRNDAKRHLNQQKIKQGRILTIPWTVFMAI